jgi:hypothetical protein
MARRIKKFGLKAIYLVHRIQLTFRGLVLYCFQVSENRLLGYRPIGLNERIIVNDRLGRMWKEAPMTNVSSTCLTGLEKPLKHLSEDRKPSVRESKQEFPRKEAAVSFPCQRKRKNYIAFHSHTENNEWKTFPWKCYAFYLFTSQ